MSQFARKELDDLAAQVCVLFQNRGSS